MRKYLASSLEDKMMWHFISKKRNIIRKLTIITQIASCLLCMQKEGQSNICREWYHEGCVEIPAEALMDKDFILYSQ